MVGDVKQDPRVRRQFRMVPSSLRSFIPLEDKVKAIVDINVKHVPAEDAVRSL